MKQAGFTLLEMIVVLLLLATITAIVLVNYNQVVKLDESAGYLQAAGRGLYDEAAVKNITLRLAYDMDKQGWWVEAYDGTYQVAGSKRDNDDVRRELEEKEKEKARLKAKYGSEENPEGQLNKEFVAIAGIGFIEPQSLPDGIRIVSVDTPQLRDPVKRGKAYTHYFPGGFAEPTVVVLADVNDPDDRNDDKFVTLETEPFTGMTRIWDGKKTRDQIEREREKEE